MDLTKFFTGLFDISFKENVTVRIIPFLYVLVLVGAAISCMGMIVDGFSQEASKDYSIWKAIWSLMVAPVFFVGYVVLARVGFEALVCLFRIAGEIEEG